MRVAIAGYGDMGKLIHKLLLAADQTNQKSSDIYIIDPNYENAEFKKITQLTSQLADVVIDFTVPSSAIENIKHYADIKLAAIIGTTGWYDSIPEVATIVEKANSKLLWSSNFSIGVNAYFKIVKSAAEVFNSFEDYDVWAYELHHKNKADSPSGTAKTLAELLLKNLERKNKVIYDKLDRKPMQDELHFSSIRGGDVNFEHTIAFDSEVDSILIKHSARNRLGYAQGAIKAANWLLQQKPGFYGFNDFMQDVLANSNWRER